MNLKDLIRQLDGAVVPRGVKKFFDIEIVWYHLATLIRTHSDWNILQSRIFLRILCNIRLNIFDWSIFRNIIV